MEGNTIRLENEDLLVEVCARGAELVRIYDKHLDREVLWEGKPEIWSRHAPILFPFIGKCMDGKYQHQGKTYVISSHGFARDLIFEQISQTETESWYRLTDTEETRRIYPFSFCLEAGYRLEGNQIRVMWKVANPGTEKLFYMLGGHPAFKTPKGMSIYDFTLDFHREDAEGPLHYQSISREGYQKDELSGILVLEEGKVPIVPGFFDKAPTYIFDQSQVDKVSLLLPGKVPYVTVHSPRIPYLGVWTMEETHPFVCLEPWFGRCDKDGYQGELAEREGEMMLEPGQEFTADYCIEICAANHVQEERKGKNYV